MGLISISDAATQSPDDPISCYRLLVILGLSVEEGGLRGEIFGFLEVAQTDAYQAKPLLRK